MSATTCTLARPTDTTIREPAARASAAPAFAWPGAVLGFIGVHCGLRTEVATIGELVRRADGRRPLEPARRRAQLLRRVLHEHHRVEDALLWPELEARRPDCANEMSLLVDEHADLDAALDALVDDPRRIEQVAESLTAHLLHEETVALPIWLDTFTLEDHEWFETRLRRTTPWRNAATMVSWLLEVTPPEAQGVALARVPSSLRLAHRLWYRRRSGLLQMHQLRPSPARG